MPEQYRYTLPVKAGEQRLLGELTGAACATLVTEIAERHAVRWYSFAPDMQNTLRCMMKSASFTNQMVMIWRTGKLFLRQFFASSGHYLLAPFHPLPATRRCSVAY
ncbi:hypothetical protein ACVXHB_03950 [Escherichia coli]